MDAISDWLSGALAPLTKANNEGEAPEKAANDRRRGRGGKALSFSLAHPSPAADQAPPDTRRSDGGITVNCRSFRHFLSGKL